MLRTIVVVGAFAGACADSQTPEPVGGETHFLHACDGTDSCGLGLECVCGVCTKPCTTDNTCKTSSTLATCEPAGTPNGACVNPQASPVCDVECSENADCNSLGSGFTCEQGSCRKLSAGACVHEGSVYESGSSFMIDCNFCGCGDGNISCTFIACNDGGMDSGLDASIDSGVTSRIDGGLVTALIDPACTTDQDAGLDGVHNLLPLMVEEASPVLPASGEVVASGPWMSSFVVHGSDIYWLPTDSTERIVRSEIMGIRTWDMGVQALENNGVALAVDDCSVYWNDTPPGQYFRVRAVRHDGINPREVAGWTLGDAPELIVPDATHLYMASATTLSRVSKLGGDVEVMRTRTRSIPASLRDVIVLNDRVLWLEQDADPNTLDGTIVSVPKDDPQAATTIVSGLANPSAMVTDGVSIYVSNLGRPVSDTNVVGAGVVHIAIAGGSAEVLWPETSRIPLIDVDDTYVYFSVATPLGNALHKIPKANPTASYRVAESAGAFMVHNGYLYWSGGYNTGAFIARLPSDAWL